MSAKKREAVYRLLVALAAAGAKMLSNQQLANRLGGDKNASGVASSILHLAHRSEISIETEGCGASARRRVAITATGHRTDWADTPASHWQKLAPADRQPQVLGDLAEAMRGRRFEDVRTRPLPLRVLPRPDCAHPRSSLAGD